MPTTAPSGPETLEDTPAVWSAVFASSLGAFALVASEFMPVSLLTPMAADLQISEGQAGQSIAVSGAFAVITSLFITRIAGRLDRRRRLLLLTGIMVCAGIATALAQNYATFMVARIPVGVAVGGFWSLSAAIAMRLVPDNQIPKALAIVNDGNALASAVAAPLRSFLGSIAGWPGARDAALTSSTSLTSFRLEELAKHLTTGRAKSYWFMLEPLVMSKAVFDRLSSEPSRRTCRASGS